MFLAGSSITSLLLLRENHLKIIRGEDPGQFIFEGMDDLKVLRNPGSMFILITYHI